jgi:hypothetical protein
VRLFNRIVGCLLILLISGLLISKSNYFFDFGEYSKMMKSGIYLDRYIREPVSALFMYISDILNGGAFGFYLITWSIYLITVIFLSFRHYKNLWFTVSMFLLFNPLTIMAFLVPRYFLALTFYLLALHLTRIQKWIVLVISILAHNILGAFAFYLLRMQIYSKGKQLFLSVSGVGLFYLIMIYQYPSYLQEFPVQGRFQTLYSLLFLFLFQLLMYRSRHKYAFYVYSFILILCLYLINVIAYRFFILWLIAAFLFLVPKLKKGDSVLIIRAFTFLSVCGSLFVVLTGRYGYGPGPGPG